VAALGLARASDSDLLHKAQELDRLFVTRDRDFGGLDFVAGLGTGVIYLPVLPSTQNATHSELARILDTDTEDELKHAFVVVEPGRHRFRKISL
jgi:predicted nuclease of predicted toxin-antitoxin system